nr:T9SS type A sorting domain-containing protein [uncultured Psychroserpens sp.]
MKNIYSIILFIFCFQLVYAQNGFEKTAIIDETFGVDNPLTVVSADIDGDGDLDVITASRNDDKLSWFENLDGLGTYSKLKIIGTSADTPTALLAHDIDNDGDLDIVSASIGDSAISWFENIDGLGIFGDQQIITNTLSGLNLSIAVADIDGDNDLDILATSNSNVYWLENLDGLGNYGAQVILDNNSYSIYVLTEDMDNDGDLDILFSHSNSEVRWLNNLNGNATSWAANDIDTAADGILEVVVADIDNINGVDLVITSSINQKIFWCQNDGSANFGVSQDINTQGGFAKSISVADIDNDNTLDVVSVAGNEVSWYKNTDGLGDFGNRQIISTSINEGEFCHTADLNNDGFIDILSASSIDDKVAWYQNTDGLGTFGEQQNLAFGVQGLKAIIKTDIDGDGDLDIISASNTGKINWYEYLDNSESFGFPQSIVESDEDFETLFAADLDGDGDMDLISVSYAFSTINWYENLDGLGDFGAATTVTSNLSGITSVVSLDLDNDTDFDIVALSQFDSKMVWFENTNGTGAFGAETILDSNIMSPQDVFQVDLDNDNDMDLLLSFRNSIQWYENTNGSFGAPNIITTSLANTHNINIEDVDGDGNIDVISASGNRIAWFDNTDGLGMFSDEILISSEINNQPKSINATDFDADGDIDIISSQDNNLTWYENLDGAGQFGNQTVIDNTFTTAKQILVEDINSNNANDFITLFSESGNNDYKIVWYKNKIVTNKISGQVLYDSNGNCDSSAIVVPNQIVSTINGSDVVSTLTDTNGNFETHVYEGDFTTQLEGLAYYFDYSPMSYASSYTNVNNEDTFNFCVESNAVVNDLNIAIYPSINEPRPGFITTYQIVYKNVGTTVLSGMVSFDFDDSKIQFSSASQTISSQSNSNLTFDFEDINPFETRTIDLEFVVYPPPTTNIDDVLISSATISPVSGDETEDDNTFILEQIVIGSYDPNDIAVLEGEEISIDDASKYLHYLIRFQNTGNASAINVRVDNILDDKLDWTTLQIESLSHNGHIEITNQTNVSFIFDNINLPDAGSDESNSHGFIAYKIKPKTNVVIGDIFYNTADIFFDFNPAISTNTVATEIVNSLSLEDFETNMFAVYPNPAKSNLTVNSKFGFDSLTIVDINGRVLKTVLNDNLEVIMSLDIVNLANGIYFLNINSTNLKQTVKFIKN